jgi:hypothetical protein
MAGVDRIVGTVLDHGIGSVGVVVVLLWWRAGCILVDNYTKLIAETVSLTVSNWLVALVGFMLAWWTPGLAAIKEQLDWLQCYPENGSQDCDCCATPRRSPSTCAPPPSASTARPKSRVDGAHHDPLTAEISVRES